MDVAELVLKADARSVDRADRSLDSLTSTSEKTQRATDRLNRENERAARQYQQAASAVKGYVAGLLGVGAAVSVFRSSVRTASEFSASMSQVQAITRATGDEMAQMTRIARELGASTEFSASQAASGLRFLGQAGFTARESIAAIPDVLDLATAAALDLGNAADIASNVMSGFGIAATETTRATDVLAAIASRANTDVKQLGDAMAYVGPVAAAMGIDIGDAAAAVGVLSDAGIQGGSAGTGLRRVLSSLANPTAQAAGVLRGLGVTLQEVNPATNNLSDVIDRLARTGMSAADALTIFGDRGGPAILALVENNRRVGELADQMKNVEGEAKRMADTMRDNLQGDAKALSSALQELSIAFAGSKETSLRGALQSVTGGVRALSENIETLESVLVGVLSVVGARYAAALAAAAAGSLAAAAANRARLATEVELARQVNLRAIQDQQAAARSLAVASNDNLRAAAITRLAAANQRAIASQSGLTAATAAYTTAAGLATRATNVLRGALAFIGGPIGVATLAAMAVYQFKDALFELVQGPLPDNIEGIRSKIANLEQQLKTANGQVGINGMLTERQRNRIKELESELDKYNKVLRLQIDLQKDAKDSAERIREAQEQQADAQKALTILSGIQIKSMEGANAVHAENAELMEELTSEYKDFRDSVQKVIDKLYPHEAAARELTATQKLLNRAVEEGFMTQEQYAKWVRESGYALEEVVVTAKRVQKESIKVGGAAGPMAKAWEEATKRIDDAFAQAWQGSFDSFSDFADGIKNALRRLLGELAHMAVTKPILVSLGIGGGSAPSFGMGGGSGAGGISSLLSTAKSLWGGFGGGTSSIMTNIAAAGQYLPQSMQAGWAQGVGNYTQQLYNTGQQFGGGIGTGALVNAGAGIAGSMAGSAAFGGGNRQANSSWGSAAGSLVGSIWGPIGSAVGGFIGSGLDVLFGSTKPSDKRQYAGVGLGDLDAEIGTGGFSGRKFSRENQDAAVALIKEMQNLSAQLGGSNASVNVSVGGRTGLRYAAGGGENYQEFEDIASLLEAAFKDILAGATNLAPAVKDLAIALEDGAENTIAYAQTLQSLWEATEQNGVTAAQAQWQAQQTLYEVYQRSSHQVRSLSLEFDGSAQAVAQLSQALGENQAMAFQLATRYQEVRDAVGSLFGGLSESIRTSLMSQEELYNYQRQQVTALGESISTLTDPEAIMQASRQAEQLMSGMWSRLSEEQREEMGPGFLETIEDFQQAATSRINEQLKATEESQRQTGELVRQGIIEASRELAASGQGFQEGSLIIQAAADAMLAAAERQSGGGEVN